MTLPSFKAAVLLLVLSWSGPSAVLAFQIPRKGRAPAAKLQKPLDPKADQGPETSSDASFDPKTLEKLAIIVAVDGPARNLQTNQSCVVEDEFVKVLIQKGYSLVSRSDIKLVVVEQQFQKSGLTDDNAVAMGKLLNVPAVMVVRINASGVENQRGPMGKRSCDRGPGRARDAPDERRERSHPVDGDAPRVGRRPERRPRRTRRRGPDACRSVPGP